MEKVFQAIRGPSYATSMRNMMEKFAGEGAKMHTGKVAMHGAVRSSTT